MAQPLDDDLLQQFGALSMGPKIDSKCLTYAAWLGQPDGCYLEPEKLTKELLTDIYLKKVKFISVAAAPKELPIYKKPIKVIDIVPFNEKVPPCPKPNILLAVASLFSLCAKKSTNPTSAQLIESLSKYKFIMPRKPLKALMTDIRDFDTYALRFSTDSPLFIDRASSYPTNPGAIGMQFEDKVSAKIGGIFRFYGVFELKLSKDTTVLVTGEVDAVDDGGRSVEIKTKPAWAKNSDSVRDLQTWVQASIADASCIITGKFNAAYGDKNGPVHFDPKLISSETTDKYGNLPNLSKERAIKTVLNLLNEIDKGCSETGCVYRIKSNAAGGGIKMTKLSANDYTFPISNKVIETLADIVVGKQ
ncbi:hypothetical protein MP638_000552 [Amoeboaphelidium occidentale]|nr:hypothetical protein MP638_000552 [Amoeboaphelidium occidentale]